ncbi:hypothetical protein PVAP13_2NG537703 [Panicum virgatum]|uniref:Uncharacterized protein n=1 Tax=Panicum virgatum TaxID=38727 RepID=A0A8T0VMU2_PANVG|nr:hypothetical protein PVAP13_2NG537703 [Panicum virgatum]
MLASIFAENPSSASQPPPLISLSLFCPPFLAAAASDIAPPVAAALVELELPLRASPVGAQFPHLPRILSVRRRTTEASRRGGGGSLAARGCGPGRRRRLTPPLHHPPVSCGPRRRELRAAVGGRAAPPRASRRARERPSPDAAVGERGPPLRRGGAPSGRAGLGHAVISLSAPPSPSSPPPPPRRPRHLSRRPDRPGAGQCAARRPTCGTTADLARTAAGLPPWCPSSAGLATASPPSSLVPPSSLRPGAGAPAVRLGSLAPAVRARSMRWRACLASLRSTRGHQLASPRCVRPPARRRAERAAA